MLCNIASIYNYELMKREVQRREKKIRNMHRFRRGIGFYKRVFIPMKEENPWNVFEFTRMTMGTFTKLCDLLRPDLKLTHVIKSDDISIEERIAITLHYLSQGLSKQTIARKYYIRYDTVQDIIKTTCDAIRRKILPTYLKHPASEEEWIKIAADCLTKWSIPNCIGALGGIHIRIKEPTLNSRSYLNYECKHSYVLFAYVDADGKFRYAEISPGHQDGQDVLYNSTMRKMIEEKKMHLPKQRLLEQTNIEMPFAFVGDIAFPLEEYIWRPYTNDDLQQHERVFNNRLSRARSAAENTFGTLVARWQILNNKMLLKDEVLYTVGAVLSLHNFLQSEEGELYSPPGFVDSGNARDGSWRKEVSRLVGVEVIGDFDESLELDQEEQVKHDRRDVFAKYFLSPVGQVPWQYLEVDNYSLYKPQWMLE